MGAADVDAAKLCISLGLLVVVVFGSTVVAGMFYARQFIAVTYLANSNAQAALVGAFPALSCAIISQMVGTTLGYALNGMSRTAEVASIQTFSIWLMTLPFGIYWGLFTPMGVQGFLWANVLGYTAKSILCGALLIRTDWNDQVEQIQQRNK